MTEGEAWVCYLFDPDSLIARLESVLENGAIFLDTHTMSLGLEVASTGTEGRKKALGVFGRREAAQFLLTPSRRG